MISPTLPPPPSSPTADVRNVIVEQTRQKQRAQDEVRRLKEENLELQGRLARWDLKNLAEHDNQQQSKMDELRAENEQLRKELKAAQVVIGQQGIQWEMQKEDYEATIRELTRKVEGIENRRMGGELTTEQTLQHLKTFLKKN